MSARPNVRAAALALAVAAAAPLVAAPLGAQSPAPRRPAVWLGVGGALPLAQPGIDRRLGAATLAAIELPVAGALWLRAEASAAAADFDTRADGPLGGDLQQARLAAAVRWSPIAVGRARPYVLAGGGLFWQSERITLRDLSSAVPDAAYEEVASRTAGGTLLGAGVTASLAHVRLFVETRWTRVGGEQGATSDVAAVGGVTLPLPW